MENYEHLDQLYCFLAAVTRSGIAVVIISKKRTRLPASWLNLSPNCFTIPSATP